MKRLWLSSWFGLVFTVAAVGAAVFYTSVFGDMFGEWGWPRISIAILILGILGVSAVGALDHQPNPYGRTSPLYDLSDVPEHSKLESAGFGWIIQLLPMVLAIGVLLAGSRLI